MRQNCSCEINLASGADSRLEMQFHFENLSSVANKSFGLHVGVCANYDYQNERMLRTSLLNLHKILCAGEACTQARSSIDVDDGG